MVLQQQHQQHHLIVVCQTIVPDHVPVLETSSIDREKNQHALIIFIH
jgi:hypothetical protein